MLLDGVAVEMKIGCFPLNVAFGGRGNCLHKIALLVCTWGMLVNGIPKGSVAVAVIVVVVVFVVAVVKNVQ